MPGERPIDASTPAEADAREPARVEEIGRPASDGQDNGQDSGMTRSELAGYRDRFTELQARFIDDPRAATDEACSLVKEAVDRMMDSMREGGDTERMRLAMRRYRTVLETIAEQTLS
ncbi:MAG: hypothetical protein M3Z98_02930 [Candidatus Dormibacteraeota bacterium]|nr:hypothetical protein [Candidatus Dormibacteraeota bacterium]